MGNGVQGGSKETWENCSRKLYQSHKIILCRDMLNHWLSHPKRFNLSDTIWRLPSWICLSPRNSYPLSSYLVIKVIRVLMISIIETKKILKTGRSIRFSSSIMVDSASLYFYIKWFEVLEIWSILDAKLRKFEKRGFILNTNKPQHFYEGLY